MGIDASSGVGDFRRSRVTAADIARGLRNLGLSEGAVVLVHSSMSRFGHVEGGAEAVVDALLETVGPEGTVMVPTLPWGGSQYVYLRSQPVFDVRQSPSRMGAISEAFRLRPGAQRSLHPSHPVAAIGPLAEYMLRDHEKAPTCCGLGTPYFRNLMVGGHILFLGVDLRSNTTGHTLDEMEAHRDNFSDETFEATVIDWDGVRRQVMTRSYSWGPSRRPRDFRLMEGPLLEAGMLSIGEIGDATVRLVNAKGMLDVVSGLMRDDSHALCPPEGPKKAKPAQNGETIRSGMRQVLWPEQPDRRPGGGIFCTRCEYEDVTIDDLRLHSPQNPDELIPAFLARPVGVKGRVPAVVCLHGSGRSREFLMEADYCFEEEKALLHGWARELARRGFAAMAIGQRCYGGRIGPRIQEWAKIELLYGRTTMGGLVEDAMCGVDYLVNHCPDVDPEGIGMTGFSLGGIVAFYATVVDPRIKATVPVCGGIGSLEVLADHGNTGFHSAYFYLPGVLKVGDHSDMLTAIFPCALLVIGSEEDVGMPVEALREMEARGKDVYRKAKSPESFEVRIEAGGHNLRPEGVDAMAEWFQRHLE